jgi:hypothetical protein
MKLNAALAKTVLLAASIGVVVPILAQTSSRPVSPKQTAKGEEEEKEGEVKGIPIARADGTWLGVTMDGLNLRLTFYNQKKNPTAPNVARATARWRLPTVPTWERAVLNPDADGFSLVGNRVVRKPWVFVVYLALVNDKEEVIESYQVQLTDQVVPAES